MRAPAVPARAAIALIPLFAFIASCGGGASTEQQAPPAVGQLSEQNTLPSNEAIIAKLYDPDYSVPDGFFVDERANTAQSYTVHHVMDESHSYELCTDDYATAEAWEAADNDSRSVNGYYVGAYENARYFEFIRELSYENDVGNVSDLTSPGYARVFKCSNTERDGVDRSLLSGYAGRINARPLNDSAIRDFAEYFWQFTFFPQRYRKVLDTYGSGNPGADGLDRTLLLAFGTTQGAGLCDSIEVVEWRFSADPATGEVMSSFDTVRTFEAESVSGSPQICGAGST